MFDVMFEEGLTVCVLWDNYVQASGIRRGGDWNESRKGEKW